MNRAQLERAQQRMEQKWYNLVMAEQRSESMPVLERLYNSYVLAMEEYNHCSQTYQQTRDAQQKKLAS